MIFSWTKLPLEQTHFLVLRLTSVAILADDGTVIRHLWERIVLLTAKILPSRLFPDPMLEPSTRAWEATLLWNPFRSLTSVQKVGTASTPRNTFRPQGAFALI